MHTNIDAWYFGPKRPFPLEPFSYVCNTDRNPPACEQRDGVFDGQTLDDCKHTCSDPEEAMNVYESLNEYLQDIVEVVASNKLSKDVVLHVPCHVIDKTNAEYDFEIDITVLYEIFPTQCTLKCALPEVLFEIDLELEYDDDDEEYLVTSVECSIVDFFYNNAPTGDIPPSIYFHAINMIAIGFCNIGTDLVMQLTDDHTMLIPFVDAPYSLQLTSSIWLKLNRGYTYYENKGFRLERPKIDFNSLLRMKLHNISNKFRSESTTVGNVVDTIFAQKQIPKQAFMTLMEATTMYDALGKFETLQNALLQRGYGIDMIDFIKINDSVTSTYIRKMHYFKNFTIGDIRVGSKKMEKKAIDDAKDLHDANVENPNMVSTREEYNRISETMMRTVDKSYYDEYVHLYAQVLRLSSQIVYALNSYGQADQVIYESINHGYDSVDNYLTTYIYHFFDARYKQGHPLNMEDDANEMIALYDAVIFNLDAVSHCHIICQQDESIREFVYSSAEQFIEICNLLLAKNTLVHITHRTIDSIKEKCDRIIDCKSRNCI
jgi:hypothetical protein